MLEALRSFAWSRVGPLVALASFGVGRSCASQGPPAAGVEGLAASLGAAVGASVDPSELAWEPSRGAWVDLAYGRHVLFLGREPEAARDLYRARVRVSVEGLPLRVEHGLNLTRTPLADETGLLRREQHASYVTLAHGAVRAVSALDLVGFRPRPDDSAWHRLWRRWRCWQETGTWAGLGRAHVLLDDSQVAVTLKPPGMWLELGSSPEPLRYDIGRRGFEGSPPAGLEVFEQACGEEQTELTLREAVVGAIGAERLSALEAWWASEQQPAREAALVLEPNPGVEWPPARLEPLVRGSSSPEQEGAWKPLDARADGTSAEASPLLWHTQLRLDPGREDSWLELVAFDLRRLQLHLQAGTNWPHSASGPSGSGRVPNDHLQPLVATFNGAGLRDATSGGLQVRGRAVNPPKPGLPSVVVTDSARVGLGLWPRSAESLPGLESFVQSERVLVEAGRPVDGGAADLRVQRELSALCRRPSGLILFAWASHASRGALTAALVHAGCEFALELDSTPGATGLSIWEHGPEGSNARPASERMRLRSTLPLEGSPRDFFYLTRRPWLPVLGSLVWSVSPGAQPEPTFIPGLFSASGKTGGIEIEWFAVDAERVSWVVTGGTGEPLLPGRAAPKRELSSAERGRATFALDLGHTTTTTRYGMVFDDRVTLPLRPHFGTLAVSGDGTLELLAPGQDVELAPGTHAVQLPALVRDAELLPRASETGARRERGALCFEPGGRLLVAFVRHDSSSPLALRLREAGCETVLELERGSQHAARLYREGTPSRIPEAPITSLLHGLSKPMPLGSFQFGADAAPNRAP